MSDTKLLQAILDTAKKLEKKVENGFKKADKRFDKQDKRIDNIGLQLARLEDNAPTIEEFDNLEKRMRKVEKQTASL